MPAQSIPPISHGQAPGGFLSSGIVRPLNTGGGDWQGGISFFSTCDVLGGIHVCNGGDKDPTIYGDEVIFDPVIVYNLQQCEGHIGSGIDVVSAENFRRVEQRQLAAEVHSGSVSGNPSFQSSAEDQTGVAVQGLCETLQALIDVVCEKGISELVLHAPFHTIPSFIEQQLAEWDPISGQYRVGHIPIIFDCYPNIGPDTPSAEAAANLGHVGNDPAGDGQAWIYATGPIEHAAATLQNRSAFEQRINQHVDLNERLEIYRFDPCSVLSALADVCVDLGA